MLKFLSRHLRARADFRAEIEKAQARPRKGPERDSIPQTTVDSVRELLEFCDSIEARPGERIFYRGQTTEYLLPGTNQISLLPALARQFQGKHAPYFTVAMARGYRDYWVDVVGRHIDFISRSQDEASLLRSAFLDKRQTLDAAILLIHNPPVVRMLDMLYDQNPYVFESALQHYGFPTLGLDVTYSPLVALYFATHAFRANAEGGVLARPTWRDGIVYVMSVPNEVVTYEMSPAPYSPFTTRREIVKRDDETTKVKSRLFNRSPWRRKTGVRRDLLAGRASSLFPPISTRPRIVDLFDLTFDNYARPRRQYGALLTEVGDVDVSDPPQLNAYSYHIRHTICLSADFWKEESTRTLVDASLGGWLFPPTDVDLLFRKLSAKNPDNFPRYQFETLESPDPAKQFDLTRKRRIVLTGSVAQSVYDQLLKVWYGRAGWLEVLPASEVMSMADDQRQKEVLDVVLVCETTSEDAAELRETIRVLGRKSGRRFVVLDTGYTSFLRDLYEPKTTLVSVVGGVLYEKAVDDPYDFDAYLQLRLFEAIIELNRMRYQDRMKPHPADWEAFVQRIVSDREARDLSRRSERGLR